MNIDTVKKLSAKFCNCEWIEQDGKKRPSVEMAFARTIAVNVVVKQYPLNNSVIGRLLGISRSSVCLKRNFSERLNMKEVKFVTEGVAYVTSAMRANPEGTRHEK